MFPFFSRRSKLEELRWRYAGDCKPEWRLVATLDHWAPVRNSIRNSPSMRGAVLDGVSIEVTIRMGPAELVAKRMRAVVPASELGAVHIGQLIGLAIHSGGVLIGVRPISPEITDPAAAQQQLNGWISD